MNTRHETPADADAIRALTLAAFANAPHSNHTEHLIVEGLRAAGALSISLVAEVDGKIVGQVAVSPVTASDGTSGWYGLGPVSVLPEKQGKGIGSRLIHQAIAELKSLGAKGCVLLGEPAYYGRFGFKTVEGLTLPGVPPAYFQALSFSGSYPKAEISYHCAFSAAAIN